MWKNILNSENDIEIEKMADYELNIDSLIQRLLEGENRKLVYCLNELLNNGFAWKVSFLNKFLSTNKPEENLTEEKLNISRDINWAKLERKIFNFP